MGNKQQQSVGTGSIFDHTVETIKAPETVSLLKYKGKKAYIVVNVACQCGLTNSNYKALQEIYDKYSPDLEILAFPCNNFGAQEPGTNEQVEKFATEKKQATFPIFGKLECENGDKTHPLYKMLRKGVDSGVMDTVFGQSLKWNFTKFLCDAEGKPIKRYLPTTSPLAMEDDIKELIAQSK